MDRRRFLATAGLTALAGCSYTDPSTPSAAPTITTPTGSPTSTAMPSDDSSFELMELRTPDTAQLHVPFSFSVVVRNTGDEKRTFRSKLSTKVDDGSWSTIGGEVSMPLSPGEVGQWNSPRAVGSYLRSLHYRLEAFDETWTTRIVPRRLAFNSNFATPSDVVLNVKGGRFERVYPPDGGSATTTGSGTPTSANGGTTPATADPTPAPEGKTWAIVRIWAANQLETPQPVPPAEEFTLGVGERTYHPEYQEVSSNPYHSGALDGKTVRRGDLMYAVPEGTGSDDVTVTWSARYENGDVEAVWGTGQ